MLSKLSYSARRYVCQSNIQRRLLFGWIPDKIKYMVVPDKRTEKEKFIEKTQKEQMKLIDDQIEEQIPAKGVFGFVIKSLMRSIGRSTVREMTRHTVNAQEAIKVAESFIVSDPRVKKTFGDDVQVTGFVGMKSDVIASQKEFKEVEMLEVVASIDGSRKSGTASIVAQKNVVSNLTRIISITVSDGHNEFDVNVDHNFSPNKSTDARVIDVKARDE